MALPRRDDEPSRRVLRPGKTAEEMGLTTPGMWARMSEEEREQRRKRLIATLDSFLERDPEEVAETFEILARAIDSHRPPGYKLFEEYYDPSVPGPEDR